MLLNIKRKIVKDVSNIGEQSYCSCRQGVLLNVVSEYVIESKKEVLFFLLAVGIFLFVWNLFVKPYEVKRLKRETTQTADKIADSFSSRSLEDLSTIEQLFTVIEQQYKPYKARTLLINELNAYFQQIQGLESFILPAIGTDSALVLFNPYATSRVAWIQKDACEKALNAHPKRLNTHKKMRLIPLDNALCVYDPEWQMFAVLNLRTTLDEHLKQERRKGYYLALLKDQVPELMPSEQHFAWMYSKLFSFLGTEWTIHVYPSGAYRESSFRRMFLIFCIISLGSIGLVGWWFLRREASSKALDPNYVTHLKQLALFDGVTNLPNRRHFLDQLNIVLKRSNRQDLIFSVCFMDCDGFKAINDNYGHPVGDQVLRHIADEVSKTIRGNDFFARFSGDEFCLILEGAATIVELDAALKKILTTIATPIFTGEHKISVTMSIGVAIYPAAGVSADSLLKHADEAMYEAKRNKKNRYVIYQP